LIARRLALRIFACYAREDIEVVRMVQSLHRALPLSRLDYDIEILTAGDDWERSLDRAIRDADLFQLFWSPAAADSEQVEREWRLALRAIGRGSSVPCTGVVMRRTPRRQPSCGTSTSSAWASTSRRPKSARSDQLPRAGVAESRRSARSSRGGRRRHGSRNKGTVSGKRRRDGSPPFNRVTQARRAWVGSEAAAAPSE
jgi:hypothetical protein